MLPQPRSNIRSDSDHLPRVWLWKSLFKGFKTACGLGVEIVILMDGEGSGDPTDLSMMVKPISEGRADLAIGQRVSAVAERGAVPAQARLGNRLLSRMNRRVYGVRLHDIGSFRVKRCSLKVAGRLRGCIKTAYCMLRTTVRYTGTRRTHA